MINKFELNENFGLLTTKPETNLIRNNQPALFKARALPLLFLPASLTGIIFGQSRLEITVPEEKSPPKKVSKPTEKKKDIVYLPDVDLILTNYANAYIAIEFTVRFIKFIQNPANRSRGKILTTDKPHLQETLLYYKGNVANLSNLEYSLESETAQCVEKLKKVQYLYKEKSFKITADEAKKFIKRIKDSVNETPLAPFLRQKKTDVFEQAGFYEIELVAENIVDNPSVRAMLDLLAYAEGTGDDYARMAFGLVKKSPHYPELIGQRDMRIPNFSRYPEISVDFGPDWTTAAGRYQITLDTWKDFGKGDFSPLSQDLAAIRAMIKLGAIENLLNGDIRQAIYDNSQRWASFPKTAQGGSIGEGTNQKAKSIGELENKYKDFRAKY